MTTSICLMKWNLSTMASWPLTLRRPLTLKEMTPCQMASMTFWIYMYLWEVRTRDPRSLICIAMNYQWTESRNLTGWVMRTSLNIHQVCILNTHEQHFYYWLLMFMEACCLRSGMISLGFYRPSASHIQEGTSWVAHMGQLPWELPCHQLPPVYQHMGLSKCQGH